MTSDDIRRLSRKPTILLALRLAAVSFAMGAASCGNSDPSSAVNGDAGDANPGSSDAAGRDGGHDVNAGVSCASGNCTLDCDPAESQVALLAETASDPKLWALGDPEPVPLSEVGDGQHHLFVGVFHEGQGSAECSPAGKPYGNSFVHDAVADTPEGPYTITAEPILSPTQVDEYDRCGIETPSYLRVDEQTEYLYYCGLSAPSKGNLAALRRRNGGAWEKVGIVAAMLPGQTSQCEPDIVRDPATGLYTLFYMSDYENWPLPILRTPVPIS